MRNYITPRRWIEREDLSVDSFAQDYELIISEGAERNQVRLFVNDSDGDRSIVVMDPERAKAIAKDLTEVAEEVANQSLILEVGDTADTQEQLDNLPLGSVVISAYGLPYTKGFWAASPNSWRGVGMRSDLSSASLHINYGPLKLVHIPAEYEEGLHD